VDASTVGGDMLKIGRLSQISGIPQRRLRYVLDHNLLPGVRLTKADRRGTRVMEDFDAFAVLLAASMLAVGCPKGMVRETVGRLYTGADDLGRISLQALWTRKVRALRLGDMRAVFTNGHWYTFDGNELPSEYKPTIELRFELTELRKIVRRAAK
jgi:hypothetical protein